MASLVECTMGRQKALDLWELVRPSWGGLGTSGFNFVGEKREGVGVWE